MGVGQYNGTYDIGYICGNAHGKINIWSKFKPVEFDSSSEISSTQREVLTGFTHKDVNSGIFVIRTFNYVNVTGWRRLTDFIGYNHAAKPFSAKASLSGVMGDPPGTNSHIEPSDTSATFTIQVTLPEININNVHSYLGGDAPQDGTLEIIEFWENEVKVKGTLSLTGVSNSTWESTYANKQVNIACSTSNGLPDGGRSANQTYYARVSGGMFIDLAYNRLDVLFYRRFQQNANDETQWRTVSVVLDMTDTEKGYIKWQKMQRLDRYSSDDKIGLRLTNFWHGESDIRKNYIIGYISTSNMFIEVLRIRGAVTEYSNWVLSNGASYFNGNPYTSSYTFPSPINTVSCANATILMPLTAPTPRADEFIIRYTQ